MPLRALLRPDRGGALRLVGDDVAAILDFIAAGPTGAGHRQNDPRTARIGA
jgi:hypothetical protein